MSVVEIPAAKLDRDAQITFHQSDSFSETTTNWLDGNNHHQPPTPCLQAISQKQMIKNVQCSRKNKFSLFLLSFLIFLEAF